MVALRLVPLQTKYLVVAALVLFKSRFTLRLAGAFSGATFAMMPSLSQISLRENASHVLISEHSNGDRFELENHIFLTYFLRFSDHLIAS